MVSPPPPPPSYGRLFIRQQNCRRKARRNFFFFSTLLLRRARKPRLVPSSFLLPPSRYYPSNNPFRRCHRLYGPLCFSCVRPGAGAGVRHMVFSAGTRPLLTVSQLRRQAFGVTFRVQATWTTRGAPFISAARLLQLAARTTLEDGLFSQTLRKHTSVALFVRQHICRVSSQLRWKDAAPLWSGIKIKGHV